MLLRISIPQNLRNEWLLSQEDVPCVCYVCGSFEIHLEEPLLAAVGTVEDWSHEELDYRVPAGAGGRLTHFKHAKMTLRPHSDGVYAVWALSMFNGRFGWMPVVREGVYAEPKAGWWHEEGCRRHSEGRIRFPVAVLSRLTDKWEQLALDCILELEGGRQYKEVR